MDIKVIYNKYMTIIQINIEQIACLSLRLIKFSISQNQQGAQSLEHEIVYTQRSCEHCSEISMHLDNLDRFLDILELQEKEHRIHL